MKVFLTILIALSSFQSWCQLNFKEVKFNLPDAQTPYSAVAIGDVSNDGLNDLVIGSGFNFNEIYDYSIFIYRQNTDCSLMSPIIFKYQNSNSATLGINVLQIADLNLDKLNDIVIGNGDSIGIFYQLEGGKFSKIESYSSGIGVAGLQSGDLNNDGLTDIAVCHFMSRNINIFTQRVGGGFSKKSFSNNINDSYNLIEIADVNGDNLNDVICSSGDGTEGSRLKILYQDPKLGISDSFFSYNYASAYSPYFHGIGIGDLNNDGRNDIVGSLGGEGYEKLLLIYQDSLGKLSDKIKEISAYKVPVSVNITDLNGDSNNEIIVGHNGWGSVTIFEKDSAQHYSAYVKFPSSEYSGKYIMAVGDLNNDHRLDIVSVENYASINILYNTSKIENLKFETKIENLKVLRDTTSLTELTSEAIVDPSPHCKINLELHKQILTKFVNENYSGDSLTIKITDLGNSTSSDTITKHYNYTTTKIISSDTIKTIISTDQLFISTNFASLNSSMNNSFSVNINSNICWNLNVDQNWLSPSKKSGAGVDMLLLSATANLSTSPRSAIVTIVGKDVPTQIISVVQEAALSFLTLSSSSVTLSDSVNNIAYLNISSNINWKILNSIDWIKIDKSEGSNDALITITASSDTIDVNRSGIIFIQGDNNITVSLNITQLFTKKDVTKPGYERSIKIYPNPFNEFINIEVSEILQNAYIEVCDISGREIVSSVLNKKSTEINLGFLSKGIYYIVFVSNNNSETRKIIKY